MPIFEYEAVDAMGRPMKGTVSGADIGVAGQVLSQRGLKVQKLQSAIINDPLAPTVPDLPKQDKFGSQIVHVGDGIVGLGHLAAFTRQLAVLLHAGINPFEAFANLLRQVNHPVLSWFCEEAREATQRGETLASVFNNRPKTFNPLYRSLVQAGERGGFLVQALNEIATYIEAEIALRNQYRMATIYPKFMAFVGLVVMLLANSIGRSMTGNDIFKNPVLEARFWLVAGPILIGIFLFLRYGTRNPEIRTQYERFLASLPWFGNTVRQFAMAKFGRAFGALHRSGMPPSECLELASQATGNMAIERAMWPAVENLRAGKGLTESLAATGVFDHTVLQMIHTGERTGEISQMLDKLAEYYDQEASVRSKQTAVATGVLVLLIYALFFGYMILSTAGPIIQAYPDAMREVNDAGQ
ncbi:MAG: type II secretion system F family protein [Chthonomonas sp.]|nr:type II secretion system F family protein [Chthonomonas sp.]